MRPVVMGIIIQHLPTEPHVGITRSELWGRVVNDYGSLAIDNLSRHLSRLVQHGHVEKTWDEEWLFRRT